MDGEIGGLHRRIPARIDIEQAELITPRRLEVGARPILPVAPVMRTVVLPAITAYQLAIVPSWAMTASMPAIVSCSKGCLAATSSLISMPRPGSVGTCQ